MPKKLIKQHKLTKRPKFKTTKVVPKTTKVVPKTRREIEESDDYKEARLYDLRKAHTARTKKRNLPGPEIVDASDAGGYGRYFGDTIRSRGYGKGYGPAGQERLEFAVDRLGSSKRPGGYLPGDWKKTGVPYIGSSRASKIVNRANPGKAGGMVSRGNGIARTKKGTKYV